MNILCILSLTACIHTHGVTLPSNDVVSLLDDCQVIYRLSTQDFDEQQIFDNRQVGNTRLGLGLFYTEKLASKGLLIPTSSSPAERRRIARTACRNLRQDFDDEKNWDIPIWRR